MIISEIWSLRACTLTTFAATAIQAIPEIAKTAGHLTVFQRTPNWAIPLHNSKISKDEMEKIREGYPEMHKRLAETRMGFM